MDATLNQKDTFTTFFQSSLGGIEITGTQNAVTAINFTDNESASSATVPDVLMQCKKELEEYFAGTRKSFTVNLAPEGTAFQQQVWNELIRVEYGKTDSYLGLAKKINNPAAVRAVGLANGKNPIAIIIPCHRIVGGNGSLTGYAGGLWRKQWLLEHEGNISGRSRTLF